MSKEEIFLEMYERNFREFGTLSLLWKNPILSAMQEYSDQQSKEVRDKAIQECIDLVSVRVEFGYLECKWEFLKQELEKLKTP